MCQELRTIALVGAAADSDWLAIDEDPVPSSGWGQCATASLIGGADKSPT